MASATPCWYRKNFASIDTRSAVVSCREKGSSTKASDGCSVFERVPDVDNDE